MFLVYMKDTEKRNNSSRSPSQEGTITNQLGPGNCLGVFSTDGSSNYFKASQCKNTFNALCTTDSETGIRQVSKSDWIHSTKQCFPHYPFSYTGYKQLNRIYPGNFWLANIRRPIIRNVVDVNQTYCIAVTVGNTNHKVYWIVRPCTEKLAALCDDTDMTSLHEKIFTITATTSYETLSTTTATISTGSEKKENRTNEIVMIALIITAVLALAVIIAVIIFYKRRNSLRSRHLPLVVPNNEVTYAQVNKPTQEKAPVNAGEPTGNNTTDDTYDHMEHHRVSQNQIPTESNYDTMQSVGNEESENDYDVTSGTNRPRQIVVDDSAEYSHMEGEVG
ncbi:unnamed protein product [Mytilus edulis]|uniref:Uncharacterized protein n=1 Tax=Mytilus edulis TaxID=6550 RepID=A0A8S3UVR0_MYTED|nr:unnamed protein product [Mytilus edulis]